MDAAMHLFQHVPMMYRVISAYLGNMQIQLNSSTGMYRHQTSGGGPWPWSLSFNVYDNVAGEKYGQQMNRAGE